MKIYVIVEDRHNLDHVDTLLIRAGTSEEACRRSTILNFKRYEPGADDVSSVSKLFSSIYNYIKYGNIINFGDSDKPSKLNIFCVYEHTENFVTHSSEIIGLDITKIPVGTGQEGRLDFIGNRIHQLSYPGKSEKGQELVAELLKAVPNALVDWSAFNIGKINNTNLIELLIFYPHTPPESILSEYNFDFEEWGLREIWFLVYDTITGEKSLRVTTREPIEIIDAPELPISSTRHIPIIEFMPDGSILRSVTFIMKDNITNRTGYDNMCTYALNLGLEPVMNHPVKSSVAYEIIYKDKQIVQPIRTYVFGLNITDLEAFVKEVS